MPTFPPAPTLFSMITCWPSRSDRYCPIRRATVAFGPPAVKETIQRTGRDGYPCAPALRAIPGTAATPARWRNLRRETFIAASTSGWSLNHLVRPSEQCRRHFDPKNLRGLEIDDELELCGHLNREFAGLLAAQDAIDIISRL